MGYPKLGHYKVFIVVEDVMYQHLLSNVLETDDNCEVHIFDSGKESLKHLKIQPDIIFIDAAVGDVKIQQACLEIKKYNSKIEVVALLEKENHQTALKLLQQDVYDYILKNECIKTRTTFIVENITQKLSILEAIHRLGRELDDRFALDITLKNSSNSIGEILKLATKASQSTINVIINGEVGTDKTEIARRIHYNSARRLGPFVAIDLSASDEDQIVLELFGHPEERFENLNGSRRGLIEEANGGTLYLDNIDQISDKLQGKLMQLFKSERIRGAEHQQFFDRDIRYIVSTTKPLIGKVKEGDFKADLYYRLLGLSIHVKPLRERVHDIVLLATYYLNRFCEENDIPPKRLTSDAADKLMHYSFPGNLSELKAIVRLAAVLSDGEEVTEDHIQFNNTRTVRDFFRKEITMKEYKEFIVQYYLEMYDNDIPLIAKKLQIGPATIYRMRKEWRKKQITH
jgi:DNA-binding NtrC family response regulator